MTLTILILSYLLWSVDIIKVAERLSSNILVSSTLITILSWDVSTAWGIVMCSISGVLTLAGLYNTR